MAPFLALLPLVGALWTQEAWPLRPETRTGTKVVYGLTIRVEGANPLQSEGRVERTVGTVRPDGTYMMRSRNLGTRITVGADSLLDETPREKAAWFGPNGLLVRWEPASAAAANAAQLTYLTTFITPPKAVQVGEGWTVMVEPGANGLKVGADIRYVLASQRDGLATVTMNYREKGTNGATATGTWTLDAKTGTPQRLEASVLNFAGETGAKATLVMVRE
jgi:hypothetical protein